MPVFSGDSLEHLFKNAVDAGRINEGMQLLRLASRRRPVFGPECDAAILPKPTTFTQGSSSPHLIFICTPTITSGVHAYAHIASHFKDTRPVSAVQLCGFNAGEPLPASPEAAIAALACTVSELARGEAFVLAGWSSAGNLAYALARYFEKAQNENLAGVALLDTFSAATNFELAYTSNFFYAVYKRTSALGWYNSTRLTAFTAWIDMLPKLYAGPLRSATLFVQCDKPSSALSNRRADPWAPSQSLRTVPLNHISLVLDGAEMTAQILEEWLLGNMRSRLV